MSLDVMKPAPEQRSAMPVTLPEHVELSVVVLVYREGKRIYQNITRLLGELAKLNTTYEVVVVSDGNTDDTVREAKRVVSTHVRVFHYPMNIGKGFALSLGGDK